MTEVAGPVAVASNDQRAEELAESDLNERMHKLERGQGLRQSARPSISSGLAGSTANTSSRRPLETMPLPAEEQAIINAGEET
jgi:hypothetical protein